MTFSTKSFVLAIVSLVALLAPEMAHAFPFSPPDGDKSRLWFIQGLFGTLDGGGGGDPLASIIGIFNGAVLCIGGILLFYTLIAGTMQTAHDGEVLGKRWSSLWLPVRTALGVAAIIPGANGYAIIQFAVIWLALQGVGIADEMHVRFVDSQNISGYTVNTASIKPEVESTVRAMVMNSACVAAFDDDIASNDSSTNAVFGDNPAANGPASAMAPGLVPNLFVYRYGCGSVIHSPYELPDDNPNAGLQIVNVQVVQALRRAVWEVHRTQRDTAISQAGAVGVQVVANYRNNVPDGTTEQMVNERVAAITDAWVQAVAQEAQSRIASITNQEVIAAIKADGWIMLGSIYIQITLAQQAVAEALGIVPEASVADRIITAANDKINNKESTMGAIWSGLVRTVNGQPFSVNEQSAGTILYAARSTNSGMSNEAGQSVGESSARRALTGMTGAAVRTFSGVDMSGSDKNPVLLAGEIGSRLTTAVFVSFGVLATIAGLASLIPGVVLGTTIAILGAIFSPLLIAMLGSGLTLSYYIPMIPYILWLGAVFGWVVLIVEAVIAAPIWAVTHLAPDGDGVVGRGGQGYMLVLSLTLRPALMVFGFAAAAAVMTPMGTFLNETFMATFFASTSPGMTGFLRILAGSVIYATLMIMIINRVFSLIHQIPDGILRWIGGGDNVIGREAQEASGGAGKAIAASTAAAGATGAMTGAAQQAGANARQLRMQKAQEQQGNAASAAQLAGNEADRSSRGIRDAGASADRMESAIGGSDADFDSREAHVKQQTGAAAVSSVGAVGADARSVLANYQSRKPGDPGRPSDKDASDAQAILSSIDSYDGGKGAKSSPEAARKWLDSASSTFAGSRFGSQLSNARGNLASVEGKMSDMRRRHEEIRDGGGGDGGPPNDPEG